MPIRRRRDQPPDPEEPEATSPSPEREHQGDPAATAEDAAGSAETATGPAERAADPPERATGSTRPADTEKRQDRAEPEIRREREDSAEHATGPAEHAAGPAGHAADSAQRADSEQPRDPAESEDPSDHEDSVEHATGPAERTAGPAGHTPGPTKHAADPAEHMPGAAEHAAGPAGHAAGPVGHAAGPVERGTGLAGARPGSPVSPGDSGSATRPDIPGVQLLEAVGASRVSLAGEGGGAAFRPPLALPGGAGQRPPAPRGLPVAEHAAPDTVIDGADLDGLTVRAASLRGDRHRRRGEPRQDALGMWKLSAVGGRSAVLLCVADGVGSQPLSHRGAVRACRLLRRTVEAEFAALLDADSGLDTLCRQVAEDVAAGLRDAAAEMDAAPRALSTTLAVAVVELAPAQRPPRCVVFGVGDSAALLLRDRAFTRLARPPGEPPEPTAMTNALPTSLGEVWSGAIRLDPHDALVLCTDGLANPLRDGAVSARLAAWWSGREIPGLLEFGWQLSFHVPAYADDRTAICAWGR